MGLPQLVSPALSIISPPIPPVLPVTLVPIVLAVIPPALLVMSPVASVPIHPDTAQSATSTISQPPQDQLV